MVTRRRRWGDCSFGGRAVAKVAGQSRVRNHPRRPRSADAAAMTKVTRRSEPQVPKSLRRTLASMTTDAGLWVAWLVAAGCLAVRDAWAPRTPNDRRYAAAVKALRPGDTNRRQSS